eukprot:5126722-Pyramimonas_sp.AAC.1
MYPLASSSVVGCFWEIRADGHSSYMWGCRGESGEFSKLSFDHQHRMQPITLRYDIARRALTERP